MQAQMQKMRDDRTKAQNDMLAVLTAEQTATWKEMQGKPFTFPARGRGGFRGPGGGGPGGGN
jgi:Spy/CpxP family protein refolding chaperone